MNKTNKVNLKTKISNLFGAFGYLSCSLQWLWAVLLYFSLINALFLFVKSNDAVEVVDKAQVIASPSSDISVLIFSAIIIVVMLVLTIYVIIRIPSTIVKTSKKVVNETAEGLTPLLLKVQHKKDTKKRHLKLSSRLIFVIKVTLIIAPLILSFLSRLLSQQMVDYFVAVVISLWLAGFSIVLFCLQYLLAKLFAIRMRDLW